MGGALPAPLPRPPHHNNCLIKQVVRPAPSPAGMRHSLFMLHVFYLHFMGQKYYAVRYLVYMSMSMRHLVENECDAATAKK